MSVSNSCKFIGRLAGLPTEKNGKIFFTLYVSRDIPNAKGEFLEDKPYFMAWLPKDDKKNAATTIKNYAEAGRLMAVEARYQTGSYDKDGETIYTIDLVVESAKFLTKAKGTPEAPKTETKPNSEYDERDFDGA
jgi:hypothetical protein